MSTGIKMETEQEGINGREEKIFNNCILYPNHSDLLRQIHTVGKWEPGISSNQSKQFIFEQFIVFFIRSDLLRQIQNFIFYLIHSDLLRQIHTCLFYLIDSDLLRQIHTVGKWEPGISSKKFI